MAETLCKHPDARALGSCRMLVLDGHESHESVEFQDQVNSKTRRLAKPNSHLYTVPATNPQCKVESQRESHQSIGGATSPHTRPYKSSKSRQRGEARVRIITRTTAMICDRPTWQASEEGSGADTTCDIRDRGCVGRGNGCQPPCVTPRRRGFFHGLSSRY
jgi:hypothetical protein